LNVATKSATTGVSPRDGASGWSLSASTSITSQTAGLRPVPRHPPGAATAKRPRARGRIEVRDAESAVTARHENDVVVGIVIRHACGPAPDLVRLEHVRESLCEVRCPLTNLFDVRHRASLAPQSTLALITDHAAMVTAEDGGG